MAAMDTGYTLKGMEPGTVVAFEYSVSSLSLEALTKQDWDSLDSTALRK